MVLPTTRDLVQALDAAYSGITAFVAGLDDDDLLAPSGCHGWSRADLLFHLTGDAQRALVALATPSREAPDTDFVGYWRPSSDPSTSTAEVAHARWIRRCAAAFDRPSGIVRLWTSTAPAAARAAALTATTPAATRTATTSAAATETFAPEDPSTRDGEQAADPDEPGAVGHDRDGEWDPRVMTQGLVLRLPDLLATLITEAVLHHLDLISTWSGAPQPADSAMDVALATIRGLLGDTRLPASWDGCETLLKCTGRRPLTESDRAELGAGAAAIPVFGTTSSDN